VTLTTLVFAVLIGMAWAADPPNDDEAYAQFTAEKISRREEAMAAACEKFDAAIRNFSRYDAASQDATFVAFQKMLAPAKEAADDLTRYYGEFRKASVEYRKALVESPAAYRRAAASFRTKAATYETAELRKRILDLADNCDCLASVMEERVRRLDELAAETAKMERFLNETTRFLGDVESFVKLYPGNQSLDLRRNYVEQMGSYKRIVESVLPRLDAFTGRLKDESGSEKLQAERTAASSAMQARIAEEEAARKRVSDARFAAYLQDEQLRRVEQIHRAVLQGPFSALDKQMAAYSLQEIRRQRAALGNGGS
jgi:hypothetical protein